MVSKDAISRLGFALKELAAALEEIFPNTDYDLGIDGRGDSTFFSIWIPYATGHRQVPIEWKRIRSQGQVDFLTYNLRLMLAGEEYDDRWGGATELPEAMETYNKGVNW